MLKKIITLAFSVLSLSAYANGGTFAPAQTAFTPHCFIGIESGYGPSIDNDFSPHYTSPTLTGVNSVWFSPSDATLDGSDFGSAPFFGAYLGYAFSPNMSVALSYDWMGNYDYSKYFPLSKNANNEIAEVFTDNGISFQPILATLRLNPSESWQGITPFVEVGAGVSINNSGDLVNYDVLTHQSGHDFYGTLTGKTMTSFAWKVGAGLDYMFHPQWHLIAGYRYIDVGRVETTDILTAQGLGQGTIQPFSADNVGINQVYLSLAYDFA